jgi:hypothetical protein
LRRAVLRSKKQAKHCKQQHRQTARLPAFSEKRNRFHKDGSLFKE